MPKTHTPNQIFRGPIGATPATVNLPLTSEALPGVAVTSDGARLRIASDAMGEVYLLAANSFTGQGISEPTPSGDTATAYALTSGSLFQARLAAGTYAPGQALSVGAGGLMEDAGTARILAFYRDAPGTHADEDLADIAIA